MCIVVFGGVLVAMAAGLCGEFRDVRDKWSGLQVTSVTGRVVLVQGLCHADALVGADEDVVQVALQCRGVFARGHGESLDWVVQFGVVVGEVVAD